MKTEIMKKNTAPADVLITDVLLADVLITDLLLADVLKVQVEDEDTDTYTA